MRFTDQEVKELVISAIVIGFIFAWVERGYFAGINFFYIFIIMLIAVGAAFIFHELSHKYIAQKYGCIAYYKMWETGLIIAFFLAVTVGIVFAAPGAVYIQPLYAYITKRENAYIAMAGPLANIALAFIFLPLKILGGATIIGILGYIGFMVNSWLALFNLLPIPPLDGSKIIAWDVKAWAALALFAFILMVIG